MDIQEFESWYIIFFETIKNVLLRESTKSNNIQIQPKPKLKHRVKALTLYDNYYHKEIKTNFTILDKEKIQEFINWDIKYKRI